MTSDHAPLRLAASDGGSTHLDNLPSPAALAVLAAQQRVEAMAEVPTVFVVHDDPRKHQIISALSESLGLPCRHYPSGLDFVDEYDHSVPGCLVCELRMAGISGLQLLRRLRRQGALLPVVFLTSRADVASAVRAMRAGAVHVLTDPCDEGELLEVLEEALAEDKRQRLRALQEQQFQGRLATLTIKQKELLEMILQGKSSRVIAKELARSVRAIELRRSRMMERLNVQSLVELVEFALVARFTNGGSLTSVGRNGNGKGPAELAARVEL